MKLFCIFHLNLMFSSIPEEDRETVIARCYNPLLRLCEENNFLVGIEASGITLNIIKAIAPEWIEKLKKLIHYGKVEFIGSGYGQIIGPLVPPPVNKANLRIGMRIYEELLGIRPKIALVNEQAWSAGLVEHYLEAGFEGIFMDYDNPARFNSWDEKIQHLPQRVLGSNGESIPILWSRSMVFQKLQRYVHGEIELQEYLNYVENIGAKGHCLAIYGNDAEIFDYRPGRYKTEAAYGPVSEWEYMRYAFEALRSNGHEFCLPSDILCDIDKDGAGQKIDLCSAEQPVPVKKQNKYNLTRWAVSGRNDFFMNTLCRAVATRLELMSRDEKTEDLWRELCFCWSSDFRTHITEARFKEAAKRLRTLSQSVEVKIEKPDFKISGEEVTTEGRLLKVSTDQTSVVLNTNKGFAIHEASFAEHGNTPIFGTLEHGYFRDISFGADFFSGHLIMEGPGSPKETDLSKIIPLKSETDDFIQIAGGLEIHQGHLDKAVRVHKAKQQIDILYKFRLNQPPKGYIRLGHITLLSENITEGSIYYSTANGGKEERHKIGDKSFDHSNNVSFLVSSSQAAGMTNSCMVIGGDNTALEIKPLVPEHAFIAMVTCRQVEPSPFVRVSFSMQEMDETCKYDVCEHGQFIFSTGFSIKPHPKAAKNV